jgi:UDP-2,4-diacetamido-2,4,6-trideoxy-beta-L-altropyranose hydrolase
MNRALLIRADGSEQIGTGHVMRCLALAEAWRDRGGTVVFALASASEALEKRLKSEGMETAVLSVAAGGKGDARKTAALARKRDASWVVVDGYAFDDRYLESVRGAGLQLAVVDDNGILDRYAAEMVINANLHADEHLYRRRNRNACLLLGSRYALIRREFRERRVRRRRFSARPCRILVTLGGADVLGLTPMAIRALRNLLPTEIDVRAVVGPSNPGFERCREEMSAASYRGEVIPAATNMAEQMAWADVAVAAAGSTCWEMASLGLPAILIVTADNQAPIAASLHKAGIAVSLGRSGRALDARIAAAVKNLCADAALRRDMSRRGRRLIDGRGAERIAQVLMERQEGTEP